MKKIKLWMIAAILCCGAGSVVSCTGNATAENSAEDTVAAQSGDVMMDAINKYLVDSIGSNYTQGDMCIPVIMMTCSDGMKNDSIFMWASSRWYRLSRSRTATAIRKVPSAFLANTMMPSKPSTVMRITARRPVQAQLPTM